MSGAPLPDPEDLCFELPSEAATAALAGALACRAEAGDILALRGDLGAGKTVFARAFINSLATDATRDVPGSYGREEEVPSPTFTLAQVYERLPAAVWHFDLYRLEKPEDAFELGIEEAFSQGISLIEWPEHLGRLLPARRLLIELTYGSSESARRARLNAAENWRGRLNGLNGYTRDD